MYPDTVYKVFRQLTLAGSLLLPACATQNLINNAIHGDGTQSSHLKVKLLKAYRGEGFIHLCLEKESNNLLGSKTVSNYTVNIPLPGNPELRLSYRSSQLAPMLLVKNNTVGRRPCSSIGEPITVLVIDNQTQLELPQDQEDAVYTYYLNSHLRGLGYVAKTPILAENHLFAAYYRQQPYNFSIELGKTGIYQQEGMAQPYLLVFTPFTMTADAVGVAFGVAGLWLYSHGETNSQTISQTTTVP